MVRCLAQQVTGNGIAAREMLWIQRTVRYPPMSAHLQVVCPEALGRKEYVGNAVR